MIHYFLLLKKTKMFVLHLLTYCQYKCMSYQIYVFSIVLFMMFEALTKKSRLQKLNVYRVHVT